MSSALRNMNKSKKKCFRLKHTRVKRLIISQGIHFIVLFFILIVAIIIIGLINWSDSYQVNYPYM